jgi:hypothetical protein
MPWWRKERSADLLPAPQFAGFQAHDALIEALIMGAHDSIARHHFVVGAV